MLSSLVSFLRNSLATLETQWLVVHIGIRPRQVILYRFGTDFASGSPHVGFLTHESFAWSFYARQHRHRRQAWVVAVWSPWLSILPGMNQYERLWLFVVVYHFLNKQQTNMNQYSMCFYHFYLLFVLLFRDGWNKSTWGNFNEGYTTSWFDGFTPISWWYHPGDPAVTRKPNR